VTEQLDALEEAAYTIGLKPSEFWELTPAEWERMARGYLARKEQADYRAALICAVLANIHRDEKKRREPYQPSDFMPKSGEQKAPQTPEQMLRLVELWNAALGGKRV